MGDKVASGDKVRPKLSARVWNGMVDVVRDYQLQHSLGDGEPRPKRVADPTIIWVRNDSGADRLAGEALEVGEYILDTASLNKENLWFAADKRNSNHPCGALVYPLPSGGIGQLRMPGPVAVLRVDIEDVDNTHVYVPTSDPNPHGNFGGPWRILWKPAGETGLNTIVAILGDSCYERKAVADEDIDPGDSGDVSVLINGVDVGSVTAYWNHLTAGFDTITAGSDCRIRWHDDEVKWILIDGTCGA